MNFAANATMLTFGLSFREHAGDSPNITYIIASISAADGQRGIDSLTHPNMVTVAIGRFDFAIRRPFAKLVQKLAFRA